MVNKYVYVTGGADRQCLSLARSLRVAGHEVAFLAMESPRNLETDGAFVPVVVTHETRDSLTRRERARVLRHALWSADAARAMRRLASDFAPDVVHVHRLYPQLSVAPIVEARRQRLPIVQTLHDYEFMSASALDASGRWFDAKEPKWTYRVLNTGTFAIRRHVHARAVSEWIAVSDFVARVHASHGIRATVIPNFADVDSPTHPFALEQRRGLVFLGTLSAEKCVLDVLEVARRLPDAPVVIAGRGPLASRVAADAASLPNVQFKNQLDPGAVEGVLDAARIAVIPSRWEEPFSLVAVEAMARGTPVVAFRSGGLGENVTRLGAGIAVNPAQDALTAACRTLLEDDALWSKCSTAALLASRTEFSRDAHVASVLAIYDRARRVRTRE